MKPKVVADYPLEVGENPLWHPFERKLYWIDIPVGAIYRFDPKSGEHETFYRGEVIGGFTIQEDGALLLFMEKGAVKILKDDEITTVIEEIPEERNTRFNDVIADPCGRVFCGTMPTEDRPAGLYRLDTNSTIVKLVEGVELSNGMGFTPDGKHLYHTDSKKGEIGIFDYDREKGSLKNRRTFVRIPESEGLPDGMTVDSKGHVWSARWDGGCLVRYTPEGQEELRIDFPIKKVSSITFGGENYRDIFITTAGGNKRDEEGSSAGSLFWVNLGIRGVPEFLSRIGCTR